MWKTIKSSLCILTALAFCAGITLVSVVCFHSELQRQQEECLSAHRILDQYRDNHQWRKMVSNALKPVGMGWLSGYDEPEIGDSCHGWLLEALHENPSLKTASQWIEEPLGHPLLKKVIAEIENVYSRLFENARVVKQLFLRYKPIMKEFLKDENLKSMARYAMNQLKTPKEETPQKKSFLSMYVLALVMSLVLAAAVVFYIIKKVVPFYTIEKTVYKKKPAKTAEKKMTKKEIKAVQKLKAAETKAEVDAIVNYINKKSTSEEEKSPNQEVGFTKKLSSSVNGMLVSAATYCKFNRKSFEKQVNGFFRGVVKDVNKEIEGEGYVKQFAAKVADILGWVLYKFVDMVKWIYHKFVSSPKDDSESSEVKEKNPKRNNNEKQKKRKNKKGGK